MPNEFDALLSEMDEAAKAMKTGAEDDKKIAAAGAAAGADPAPAGDAEGSGAAVSPDGEEDEMAKSLMMKSLVVKDKDGKDIEAFDGALLVKSFIEELGKARSVIAAQNKVIQGLVESAGGHREMIKALTDTVAKIGAQGAGRRATVTVHAKNPDPEPLKTPFNKDEFFTKALAAQRAGKLSGDDLALAENLLNRGQQPPAHVLRAINS